MQDWNEYMNQFLQEATNDNLCDKVRVVPRELGNIQLSRKRSLKGILYFDWNMNFEHNMDVMRTGNYGRDEIQLIFSLNQDIKWRVEEEGQEVELKKGEVCVYRYSTRTHSMSYEKNTDFLFKSIQIPTYIFHELLMKYFPEDQVERMEEIFLHQMTKTKITPDMYQILKDVDQSERYLEFENLYLEGKMIELISIVLHSISYHETLYKKRLPVMAEEERNQLLQIKLRIEERPEMEYCAEELANDVCMSLSKFNRVFRQLYGVSLHSYVIDTRLRYAANLLGEGKYTISEVAALSGYTNMSHFSSSFRKKYGVLTREYR